MSTLPVSWSSNVDGFVGSGIGAVKAALKTPGAHTLTASTTDKDNMSAQAVVHVTVTKPEWSIKIAVTDLGGQPVALTGNLGVLLQGRQGDVYFIKAKPSAPSNQAQPPCTAVTWNSGATLQDLGNCLARITLDTQGTFTVKALLANPWGGTVTYPLVVQVGPPPTVVSPSIEGITVQSASRGVLTNGDAFGGGEVLTLTMRYLNAARASTPVTYNWSYRMDSEPWVALPAIGRTATDLSSRKFSYSGYKNNHTFTFRCIVTTTAGGVTVTTRTVSLTYIGTPA